MGGASLHRVHKSVPRADPYSTPAVFVLSPVYNGFPLEEAILCRLPPPTAGSPTHTHTPFGPDLSHNNTATWSWRVNSHHCGTWLETCEVTEDDKAYLEWSLSQLIKLTRRIQLRMHTKHRAAGNVPAGVGLDTRILINGAGSVWQRTGKCFWESRKRERKKIKKRLNGTKGIFISMILSFGRKKNYKNTSKTFNTYCCFFIVPNFFSRVKRTDAELDV